MGRTPRVRSRQRRRICRSIRPMASGVVSLTAPTPTWGNLCSLHDAIGGTQIQHRGSRTRRYFFFFFWCFLFFSVTPETNNKWFVSFRDPGKSGVKKGPGSYRVSPSIEAAAFTTKLPDPQLTATKALCLCTPCVSWPWEPTGRVQSYRVRTATSSQDTAALHSARPAGTEQRVTSLPGTQA